MTIQEINRLIVRVQSGESLSPEETDKLLVALQMAREFAARRSTGQPMKYGPAQGVGVGPEAAVKVEDLRDGL